jgi:CRP/FNR family transcriptional regulator, polysaccharide utilization system transcription regulator
MTKIAVIEDNSDMRENICEILELANYKVVSAPDGKAGVELVRKELPNLILCDIMMPELDGYGVLYYLSKYTETSSIPFVFLSAKSEKEDFRKGMLLGADDYLTKPLKEMELLDAIEARLKRSSAIRSLSTDTSSLQQFISSHAALHNMSELALKSRTKNLERKEQLYFEGDQPSYIYYIVEGKIRTYRVNAADKELVTALYNQGDYFGHLELLQDRPYKEYAAALEDCKSAMISKEDFFSTVLSNREVAASFMSVLAKNVSDKEQDLVQMAYDTVRKRVASALVRLYGKFNTNNEKHFAMTISRDELASIVGTATESVIRILSEFKADGWIHVRGSLVEIIDIEPLRKYRF